MRNKSFYLLGGLVLLIHNSIFANGIIPTAVFIYPPLILLLPIIIWLEAKELEKQLKLDRKKARALSFKANMISTLVGIPLTFSINVIFIIGELYNITCINNFWIFITNTYPKTTTYIFGIFSLPPFETLITYLILITLFCLYFFLITCGVEYLVIKQKIDKTISKNILKRVVFYANAKSYALVLFVSVLMIFTARYGFIYLDR